MSPMEVMIEELQADQRIPRGISFRKGMRFASEGTRPITEGAVDSLDVNRTGFGNTFAQNGTDLMERSFPCSSLCLMVCVKRTSGGTTSGGRPSFPERIG